VRGTKNVLDFAEKCCENGQFQGFHHVSTVAVAGTHQGMFYEDDLVVNQGFNNAYEQSKFEAERLVRDYQDRGIPAVVYRPGIISGHSETGHTSNFKVFYQPLHILSLGLFKVIPADRSSYHYISSVDAVAEAIYIISKKKEAINRTFHTINPAGVTLKYFLDLASKHFDFKIPEMIPLENFRQEMLTEIQWALIEPYVPYFNFKSLFDSGNAEVLLGCTDFKWPDVDERYFQRIFNYCLSSGFIKQRKNRASLQS
jgi:thioester reductase-like protein